jgi:glycosyltransferase involved in cell wall biosynthesis
MARRRLRLLFLESLPSISGGQAVLLDLAAALQGRYDMWALLPAEGPLAEGLRDRRVECRFAPIGRYGLVRKSLFDAANYALRLPWLCLVVAHLVRAEQIDLVYANSSRSFVWGSLGAAMAGRPIIWHQHSVMSDGKTLALLNLVGRLPAVRQMIAVSAAAGANLPALKSKMVVVPNGVDTARFRPDRAAGAVVRQELELPAAAQVIGIVGDLIPLKSQVTFLEAARRVVERSSAAHFLVVGAPRPDGDSQRYAARLREQAATLGSRVTFAGHRTDMPAVLNALDVLTIASSTETVPLVLLEALACGVPVVSTPVGRSPELLADGATGRLFPIGDAQALAAALLELLDAPAARVAMAQRAREIAEKCFQLAGFVENVEGLINAALSSVHANLP